MREAMLAALRAEPIDWRYKAGPLRDGQWDAATLSADKTDVLDGSFPLPVAVLKASAVEHNLEVMAEYCRDHAIDLAPHGKTTMSPQLVERQLQAGAWGITVATVAQARVYRHFGVRRLLLANQLVDRGGLAWAAAALAEPDVELYCLVDGLAGVARMAAVLGERPPPQPLRVLVELGVPGRRTGCRTTEEAEAVAAAVDDAPHLELAGVEGFEGVIGSDRAPQTVADVDRFLDWLRTVTERLLATTSLGRREETIVTAGGSAYPDRVVERLGAWSTAPVRVVLRSGCYLAHDSGLYAQVSPLPLQPALEIWGPVLSRPEPELAIVGFGRRDVSFDSGLPVPQRVRSDQGNLRDLLGTMTVHELNDQHAFVTLPAAAPLEVGELMGCGISHPCTTFDKWSAMPVVDDGYRVVDVLRTFF
jgi:D-serine deaminase-like pyridoxal phosphate-dependent protein